MFTNTGSEMDASYQHKILIVDDSNNMGKIFDDITKDTHIKNVFADTGESALEVIKATKQPFSIVICEQNLFGMKGTQFLEHIRQFCPYSSLFLMADQADVNAITIVVNKGIIQRYITKPLNPDELPSIIKSGIKMFERLQDNEKLLRLAKHQNTKLYDLNCELMEATKSHNKTVHKLDKEIEQLEKDIQEILDQPPIKPDIVSPEIEKHIMDGSNVNPENIHSLFSETIQALHGQFTELAHRNGFEMPLIKSDEKDSKAKLNE